MSQISLAPLNLFLRLCTVQMDSGGRYLFLEGNMIK